MSDFVKQRFLAAQMGATSVRGVLENLMKASGDLHNYCDQCCHRFTDDFRLFDYLIQKESTWEDDCTSATPRILCRECFEERNTLPDEPAPEGTVWFSNVSPVMPCPKCKQPFANRYAKRHKGGLPVQGEAGKIVCGACQRDAEMIKYPTGDCQWCGAEFSRTRSDAKFCSAKCRVASSRTK